MKETENKIKNSKSESIGSKLMKIQCALKAPKNQYNSFGKYKYRSLEDITEAAKPLLLEHGCALIMTDDIIQIGVMSSIEKVLNKNNGYDEHEAGIRTYVKVTATLISEDETISVQALAREPSRKKGMDEAQITGATSSYARKYCLNGLFAIDDTKDADSMDNSPKNESPAMYQPKKSDNIETGFPPKLIDEHQLRILQQAIMKREIDISKLHDYCKIKSLTQLPEEKYETILGYVQQKPLKEQQ